MRTMKFDIRDLVRKNVRELKPYSSARDEYVSDGSQKIFMDANENPFESGINRYPDPQQRKLKVALSELKEIPADSILLGNGSDEVLDLVFRAFCEPNLDNIITVPPTYGMYKVLADVNGIENREVVLKEGFQLDVEGILGVTDKNTKLLFICSPNNPTGNRFQLTDIQQLLESFNGLLVLDEAYIDFSTEPGWLSKLGANPNLLITQTLSKAYGMAGIRLGTCYASADIIRILNRIKPPYNVNELTQKAALDKLNDRQSVKKQIKQIIEERNWLIGQLGHVDFITEIFPTDANFILARVDNANKRYQQILDRGIVVRNRSNLPLCEDTLRFTVGTSDENKELVKVLKTI